MKGWIALDIDGTITAERYSVPKDVIACLEERVKEGWRIAIATGRSSRFASMALEKFPFPFVLLAQNGSAILQMPSREMIYKKYLPTSSIEILEKSLDGIKGLCLMYGGQEKGDLFYYKPDACGTDQEHYLQHSQVREKETAKPVSSFAQLEQVPLVKCVGSEEEMLRLSHVLRRSALFEVTFIRDPFQVNSQLLLVTDQGVSKGEGLRQLFLKEGRGDQVIAAGDDENDESMLKEADIRIVMPHATETLKKLAHFIAPPTAECGIIKALLWALQQ